MPIILAFHQSKEGPGIQCHPWLHCEFEANLGYMTPFLKSNKQQQQKPPSPRGRILDAHLQLKIRSTVGFIERWYLKAIFKKYAAFTNLTRVYCSQVRPWYLEL